MTTLAQISKHTALWVAVLTAFLCPAGAAQRAVVEAATMSAAREAARVYLVAVDFDLEKACSRPFSLPGMRPAGQLQLVEGGQRLLASTLTPDRAFGLPGPDAQAFLSVFQSFPLRPAPIPPQVLPSGRRQWLACTLERPMASPLAVVLTESEPGKDGGGSMEAWELRDPGQPPRTLLRWNLPGQPVCAVALPASPEDFAPRIAVLCRAGAQEAPQLVVGRLAAGSPRPEELEAPLGPGDVHVTPAGLAAHPEGRALFVLVTGFALDSPQGESVSWLHALDAHTLEPLATPITLPGSAHAQDAPLCAAGRDACWTATRTLGADFARVAAVELAEDGGTARLAKRAGYALPASGPVLLAPQTDGPALAVAYDRVLEVWPQGERGSLRHTYTEPLSFLRWSKEGLLAGEGNRIHLADTTTAAPRRTVSLAQGFVAGAVFLPPSSPAERNETVPPEAPPPMVFHAEAAGKEIRAWPVPEGVNPADCRIRFDRELLPWLEVIQETQPERPQAFYLFMNPARFGPGAALQAPLCFEIGGTRLQPLTSWSTVRAASASGNVQRILWIRAANPQPSLRHPGSPYHRLAEFLAAPPLLFAHQEQRTPYDGPLLPFTIVVIEAEAALQGIVTRAAILDYVAQGGGLLFFGAPAPDYAAPALQDWLSPLHIRIDTGAKFSGGFKTVSSPLTRHWTDFPIQEGALFQTPPEAALAGPSPEEGQAVFAAVKYGYGRAALLSAVTPLLNTAMTRETHRAFAADLFSWLARARHEYADMDGDRLPDAQEDANNNGKMDPGETHYLRADTDGDGIPDGIEDANLNGAADDGETDPRNPDSDGDGLLDGADPTPCPSYGAPYLAAVIPPQAPAEGGYWVTVTGRNFTPGMQFLFDGRPPFASRTLDSGAVEVLLPPCTQDSGGPVDVRAVRPGEKAEEALLLQGFLYAPRSRVTLHIQETRPPVRRRNHYQGRVSLSLDYPEGAQIQRLSIHLQAEPAADFSWANAELATPGNANLQMRRLAPGRILLSVEAARPYLSPGPLLEISWSVPSDPAPGEPIVLHAASAIAATPGNTQLVVGATPSSLELVPVSAGRVPRKPRR